MTMTTVPYNDNPRYGNIRPKDPPYHPKNDQKRAGRVGVFLKPWIHIKTPRDNNNDNDDNHNNDDNDDDDDDDDDDNDDDNDNDGNDDYDDDDDDLMWAVFELHSNNGYGQV